MCFRVDSTNPGSKILMLISLQPCRLATCMAFIADQFDTNTENGRGISELLKLAVVTDDLEVLKSTSVGSA
ncbi:hypothetical protein P8452_18812 [Trifolium repens]|nr:hypothetical protein P8452_18812 [Trifolium repens]